mgnify:CR=1 FL=1
MLSFYSPFTHHHSLSTRIYSTILPLTVAQAEDPNRVPEPELEIMHMLLESLVLLCQRRGLREELRKRKVR